MAEFLVRARTSSRELFALPRYSNQLNAIKGARTLSLRPDIVWAQVCVAGTTEQVACYRDGQPTTDRGRSKY